MSRYFWYILYAKIGDNELSDSKNNVKAIFFIRHAVAFFACQSIIGTLGTFFFWKCNCIHFEMMILVINIETNYKKIKKKSFTMQKNLIWWTLFMFNLLFFSPDFVKSSCNIRHNAEFEVVSFRNFLRLMKNVKRQVSGHAVINLSL